MTGATVQWLPQSVTQDTAIASLAAGASVALSGPTIQDPADSTNQIGTIVGGHIDVSVSDAGASEVMSPPHVILCLFRPGETPPSTLNTAALLKKAEGYIWMQSLMKKQPKSNSATQSLWAHRFVLGTKRVIDTKGTKIIPYVFNRSNVAFGAGATAEHNYDLYLKVA